MEEEQGMASLGGRIRKRRLDLGWTQDDLAVKAGLSKGFLSDLENGKRGISADKLFDLARVLSLSLDSLMENTGEQSDPRKEIEIPASLARFASEAGLSFRQTLMVLDMRRQIIAHRSTTKSEDPDKFDWQRFYESVREFL
jgi:transcriptional regulator with XRE-family HTH domain